MKGQEYTLPIDADDNHKTGVRLAVAANNEAAEHGKLVPDIVWNNCQLSLFPTGGMATWASTTVNEIFNNRGLVACALNGGCSSPDSVISKLNITARSVSGAALSYEVVGHALSKDPTGSLLNAVDMAQYFDANSANDGRFKASATATSAVLNFEKYANGDTSLPNPFYVTFKAKTAVGNANCIISVTLDDVNEPPKFSAASYSRSVVEASKKNLPIGEVVAATDLDSGSELTFTIEKVYLCTANDACATKTELPADPGNNLLDIKACSGQLFVGKDAGISFITHRWGFLADLKVTDSNGLFDRSSVTVSVIDKNDAPTFKFGNAVAGKKSDSQYSFDIKENMPAGTSTDDASFSPSADYASIAASDAEDGDPCTKCKYYLVAQADAPPVLIDETTGKLTTTKSLDYCTRKTYEFEIQVKDNGDPDANGNTDGNNKLTTTVKVTLSIVDDNDAPVLTPTGTRYVSECNGACPVRQDVKADKFGANVPANDAVAATDQDITFASGGAQSLTYSITAGNNPNNNVMTYFGVDATTGQIYSKAGAIFDYEGDTPVYFVNVTATDGCKVAGTCTAATKPLTSEPMTIRVELLPINEAPVVTAGQTRSVKEDAAVGSLIGTPILATDPDHARQADAEAVEFTLTGAHTDIFAIERFSGQLSLKGALDYETKNTYTVTVQVTDVPAAGLALSGSAEVVINIDNVNEPPVIADKSVDFNEFCTGGADCSAADVQVTSIVATDPDALSGLPDGQLDGLTYAITSVSPSRGCGGPQVSCDNVFYMCQAGQPNICMNGTRVSYEEVQEFVLTVSVSDKGTPALSSCNQWPLDPASGCVASKLTIKVQDVNEAPVYFYQSSDPSNPLTEYQAQVKENAAATSLGSFFVCDKDKFDTPTLSALTVTTTDNVYPAADACGTGLACKGFSLSMVNAGSNGDCATYYQVELKTTAAMPPTAGGVDSREYTITFAYRDIDPTGQANINSWCVTPSCCVANECTGRKGGSHIGTKTIKVTANNLNDRPVVTPGQSFTVSEMEPDNTKVLHTIQATDADDPTGAGLSYVLAADANNYYTAFNVDSTGQITLKKGFTLPLCQAKGACTLDYEQATTFNLQVFVRDNFQVPAVSETETIAVTVTNKDEPPYFAKKNLGMKIVETAAVNTPVVATDPVDAIDVDTIGGTVQQTTVKYSFKNAQTAFKIDPGTGVISVASALNYDGQNVYQLVVVATSGAAGVGEGTKTDEAQVTINVDDVNGAPAFVDVAGDVVTDRTSVPCVVAGQCNDNPKDPSSGAATGVESLYSALSLSVPEATYKGSTEPSDLVGTFYIRDDNPVATLAVSLTGADGTKNPTLNAQSAVDIFALGTPQPKCFGAGASQVCTYAIGVYVNAPADYLNYEGTEWTTDPEYKLRVVVQDKAPMGITIAALLTIKLTDSPDIRLNHVMMAATMQFNPKIKVAGGEQIMLSGEQLKAPWDTTSVFTPTAVYGLYDTLNKAFKWEYKATNCAFVAGSANNVTCDSVPGIGMNHRWKLTINYQRGGGQFTTFGISAGDNSFSSYQTPTITDISNDQNMPTTGGQLVTLTGTNFGPLQVSRYDDTWPDVNAQVVQVDTPVTAVYTATQAGVAATGCKITAVNPNTMVCTTVAGVGNDLEWKAEVGDSKVGIQAGEFTTLGAAGSAYAPPTISTVTFGPNVVDSRLNTDGGEYLEIKGTNFGPVGTAVTVTYGGANNDKYTAADCCVEADEAGADARFANNRPQCLQDAGATDTHTVITCKSAAGVGQNLKFLVTVGKQTSAAAVGDISYARPIITSIEGPGAESSAVTEGGQQLLIRGSQFGVSGERSVSLVYGPSAGMVFSAQNNTCQVINKNLVECKTGEGTGVDHSWQLTVAGQTSDVFTDTDAQATGHRYGEPVIYGLADTNGNAISGAVNGAPSAGGKTVVISGRNFGSTERFAQIATSVTYGKCKTFSAVETTKCIMREYTATNCRVVNTQHREIRCSTVPGTGAGQKWLVEIDGQYSTSPSTSYQPPVITMLTNAVGTNTHGGDLVTITGSNFGPAADSNLKQLLNPTLIESVTYGPTGTEYTAHPHPYKEGSNMKNCTKISDTEITCTTVAGSGSNLLWQVTIAGQSNALNSDAVATSSYAGPKIKNVAPLNGPTSGKNFITITGENFGNVDGLKVEWCDDVEGMPDGTSKNCMLISPAAYIANKDGSGTDQLVIEALEGYGRHPLQVKSSGQASLEDFAYTYDDPVISNIRVEEGYGGPGDALWIIIEGANFFKQTYGEMTTGRLYIKPSELTEREETDFKCGGKMQKRDPNATLCAWTHTQIRFQLSSGLSPSNAATVVVGTCAFTFPGVVPASSCTNANQVTGFGCGQCTEQGANIGVKDCCSTYQNKPSRSNSFKFAQFSPVIQDFGKTGKSEADCAKPGSGCRYYSWSETLNGASSVVLPTSGGGVLRIQGKFFGNGDTEKPYITVGGQECKQSKNNPAQAFEAISFPDGHYAKLAADGSNNNLAYPIPILTEVINVAGEAQNFVSKSELRCQLPPGQGVAVPIVVWTGRMGDSSNFPPLKSDRVGLGYSAPMPTWGEYAGKAFSVGTKGATNVTIKGANMGCCCASDLNSCETAIQEFGGPCTTCTLNVKMKNSQKVGRVLAQSDNSIVVNIPAGEGTGDALVLETKPVSTEFYRPDYCTDLQTRGLRPLANTCPATYPSITGKMPTAPLCCGVFPKDNPGGENNFAGILGHTIEKDFDYSPPVLLDVIDCCAEAAKDDNSLMPEMCKMTDSGADFDWKGKATSATAGCSQNGGGRMLVKGKNFGDAWDASPFSTQNHVILMNGKACPYSGIWHTKRDTDKLDSSISYIDTFACDGTGTLPQPGAIFTVKVSGQQHALPSPTLTSYTLMQPTPNPVGIKFDEDEEKFENKAHTNGGAVIKIEGSNFPSKESDPAVRIGGEICAITSIEAGYILCTVPAGSGQMLDLVVSGSSIGSSLASLPIKFSYLQPKVFWETSRNTGTPNRVNIKNIYTAWSSAGNTGFFDIYNQSAPIATPIEVEQSAVSSNNKHGLTFVAPGEGETFTVHGENFGPNGSVTATLTTQAGVVFKLAIANQGQNSFDVTVPPGEGKSHEIQVQVSKFSTPACICDEKCVFSDKNAEATDELHERVQANGQTSCDISKPFRYNGPYINKEGGLKVCANGACEVKALAAGSTKGGTRIRLTGKGFGVPVWENFYYGSTFSILFQDAVSLLELGVTKAALETSLSKYVEERYLTGPQPIAGPVNATLKSINASWEDGKLLVTASVEAPSLSERQVISTIIGTPLTTQATACKLGQVADVNVNSLTTCSAASTLPVQLQQMLAKANGAITRSNVVDDVTSPDCSKAASSIFTQCFTSTKIPHTITINGLSCKNIQTTLAANGNDAYQECTIPAGQGKGVPMLVIVGNQNNKEQAYTYSYSKPVISTLAPNRGPTSGIWVSDQACPVGSQGAANCTGTEAKKGEPYLITLTGENFGVDPRITYALGRTSIDPQRNKREISEAQVFGFIQNNLVVGKKSGAVAVVSSWNPDPADETSGSVTLTVDVGASFSDGETICTYKLKTCSSVPVIYYVENGVKTTTCDYDSKAVCDKLRVWENLCTPCSREQISAGECVCDKQRADGQVQFSDEQQTNFLNNAATVQSSIRMEIPNDYYNLNPTMAPTSAPTKPAVPTPPPPTVSPTQAPTGSASPTRAPTAAPTKAPTVTNHTSIPTRAPTLAPTSAPTANPTVSPTRAPTRVPTAAPTNVAATPAPTSTPTSTPTRAPTVAPTSAPTLAPTPVVDDVMHVTVSAAIMSWEHETITFQLPEDPGWGGHRLVYVATSGQSAGGNVDGESIQYWEPSVSSITPPLVPTYNGASRSKADRQLITVTGANFGTGGMYRPVGSSVDPIRWGAEVRIFGVGATVVPAYEACQESRDCVLCKICGNDDSPASVAKCRDPTLKQRHDQIVCLPDSGVGAGLTIQVSSQPPVSLLPPKFSPNKEASLAADLDSADMIYGHGANVTWSKKTFPFGYNKPVITEYAGTNDAQGTTITGTQLTVLGANFGEAPNKARVSVFEPKNFENGGEKWLDCEQAKWTDLYLEKIGVDPSKWVTKSGNLGKDPYVVCEMPRLTAGYHTVNISAASQSSDGNSVKNTMLKVLCKGGAVNSATGLIGSGGFFGQPGEYCQPCPPGALCATQPICLESGSADSCTGTEVYTEPKAQEGFWRKYIDPWEDSCNNEDGTGGFVNCTRSGVDSSTVAISPPEKSDPYMVKVTLKFGVDGEAASLSLDPTVPTAQPTPAPTIVGANASAVPATMAPTMWDDLPKGNQILTVGKTTFKTPKETLATALSDTLSASEVILPGGNLPDRTFTLAPRRTCKPASAQSWAKAGLSGACSSNTDCSSGFCDSAKCAQKRTVGEGCSSDDACASGGCEESKAALPFAPSEKLGKASAKEQAIEARTTNKKTCARPAGGKQQNGAECAADSQCVSGYCDSGIVAYPSDITTAGEGDSGDGVYVYYDVEITTRFEVAKRLLETLEKDVFVARKVISRRLQAADDGAALLGKASLVTSTTKIGMDPSMAVSAIKNPYFVACEPRDACTGDNYCAPAYAGERCTVCAEDYFKLSGECQKCPECRWCMPLLLTVALIMAGSCGWVLAKREVNLGVLSIGIDYFQVLALFARSKVGWPDEIRHVYEYMSFFNINIDLLAPECSFPAMPYVNKWLIIEFMPIMAFACFGMVHMMKYGHKRFVQKRTRKLHNHKDKMLGYMLLTFYVFYLYITKTSLDIFNCSPVEPDDGKQYLEVVFEACDTPGGVYMTLVGPAVIFFCLYSVGYPLFVAFILIKNSDRVKEDQLLRAKDTGNSHATNPTCYAFRKRYHLLYYQYKPDYYYWILVILSRKFLIATSGLLFRRTPVFLLAFALLILFVSYALQVRHSPYMSMSERAVVLAQHEAELKGADVLVAKVNAKKGGGGMGGEDRASARKRKMQVKASKKMAWHVTDQRKAAAQAANYFWNYNSVEAVLLFCACIVLISGLMFSSDGLAPGTTARKSLTYLIMFIVIGSILYFSAVLGTELVIGLGLWKPKEKPKNEEAEDDASKDTVEDDVIQFAAPAANPMHGEGRMSMMGGDQSQLMLQTKQQQEAIEQQQAEIARLKKANRVAQLKGYNSSSTNLKKKKKLVKKKTFGNEVSGEEEGEEII